jgi:hypothetical protein
MMVGFKGKTFLDVGSLREAVRLLGNGTAADEVERRFGLRKGAGRRIGTAEVVDVVR